MKHKKAILISVSAIVLLIAIFVIVAFSGRLFSQGNDEKDSYDERIDVLNESYPTDIVVYGEKIPFRSALQVRYIEKFDDESLKVQKDYQIIVISDLDGTSTISDDDLNMLKKHMDETHCDVYYLGTKLFDKLVEYGFISSVPDSTEYSIGIVWIDEIKECYHGIWGASDVQETNDNRETMSQVLVAFWDHVLKERFQ